MDGVASIARFRPSRTTLFSIKNPTTVSHELPAKPVVIALEFAWERQNYDRLPVAPGVIPI